MLLKRDTKLWITANDATSETTLEGLCLSFKGGMELNDNVVVATTHEEAEKLELKRAAIERMNELMKNMTPKQAHKAVYVIQDQDELMETHD